MPYAKKMFFKKVNNAQQRQFFHCLKTVIG